MEFSQPKAIYQQIADQLCRRIVEGELEEGQRIPSIRELAAEIGVNPNTVTKTYQSLTDMGAIETQRGLGYFVAAGARKRIIGDLRGAFVRDELPQIFRKMRMLGFSMNELMDSYNEAGEGEGS